MGERVGYVQLTEVWARDGEAAVLLGALEDGGFHPVIECDPLGPFHMYGWPFGSASPIVVWVPEVECLEAQGFLSAECEPSWDEVVIGDTFAGLVLTYRRWIYLAWLLGATPWAALFLGVWALLNSPSAGSAVTEGGPETPN